MEGNNITVDKVVQTIKRAIFVLFITILRLKGYIVRVAIFMRNQREVLLIMPSWEYFMN